MSATCVRDERETGAQVSPKGRRQILALRELVSAVSGRRKRGLALTPKSAQAALLKNKGKGHNMTLQVEISVANLER